MAWLLSALAMSGHAEDCGAWDKGAASSRRYSLATTSDRFSVATRCTRHARRDHRNGATPSGTTLAASYRIASVPIDELDHAPVELQLLAVCGSLKRINFIEPTPLVEPADPWRSSPAVSE